MPGRHDGRDSHRDDQRQDAEDEVFEHRMAREVGATKPLERTHARTSLDASAVFGPRWMSTVRLI
jgi:hypothetical protein